MAVAPLTVVSVPVAGASSRRNATVSTAATSTSPADRYSAQCTPVPNAAYAASNTCFAPGMASCAGVGVLPVSMPSTTYEMNGARPMPFRVAVTPATSREETSAPRIATPVTAPISRLVLAADAAIPERSAGTALRTDVVTGTTVTPIPMPTRASETMRPG
jgi:hypothetical protein